MKKLVFLSFFFVVTTLFAVNKPLGNLNVVVQDLVIREKIDQNPHPVKRLKQKLTKEIPSGDQSLHAKIEAELAEKEKIKKAKENRIHQKSLEKSMKKNEKSN